MLILPFILFSNILFTQHYNKYRKLTKPEKQKIGNNDHNKLYGDIYTLCFFIDTQKGEWTEEEVEYYLLELESSQYWIADEAALNEPVFKLIASLLTQGNGEVYISKPLKLIFNLIP